MPRVFVAGLRARVPGAHDRPPSGLEVQALGVALERPAELTNEGVQSGDGVGVPWGSVVGGGCGGACRGGRACAHADLKLLQLDAGREGRALSRGVAWRAGRPGPRAAQRVTKRAYQIGDQAVYSRLVLRSSRAGIDRSDGNAVHPARRKLLGRRRRGNVVLGLRR